jgi:hypothetical protein
MRTESTILFFAAALSSVPAGAADTVYLTCQLNASGEMKAGSYDVVLRENQGTAGFVNRSTGRAAASLPAIFSSNTVSWTVKGIVSFTYTVDRSNLAFSEGASISSMAAPATMRTGLCELLKTPERKF